MHAPTGRLDALRQLQPLPLRWATIGATSAGAAGAAIGLIVGLFANAPTALFAMIELGIPAAVVGGLVGLLIGLIVAAGRGASRKRRPHDSMQIK
jgi:hypothetical protein